MAEQLEISAPRAGEVTEWFPGWLCSPDRVGVYAIGGPSPDDGGCYYRSMYSYWNGLFWTGAGNSPRSAYESLGGRVVGYFFWRGLTEDAGQ